jgi:hypothetical protein
MKPKPKYVYHGSPRKLEGDKLVPKQATDLAEAPENFHLAVYASDIKGIAIAMAIIASKGVEGGSLNSVEEPYGIMFGLPKQEYIYLHTLSSETFEPAVRPQWISHVPVKPIKTEKLLVKDYLHLVRKATEEETKAWKEKYKDTLTD